VESVGRELRLSIDAHILDDTRCANPPDAVYVRNRLTVLCAIARAFPIGHLAVHLTCAPDEGNMFLCANWCRWHLKERFLGPMVRGRHSLGFF